MAASALPARSFRAAGFCRPLARQARSRCSTAPRVSASPSPISAWRRIGRASRTACNRATSRSIPAWYGRAPTGRRACWSRSPPPKASRTSATPPLSTCCRRPTSPARCCWKTCRPGRTSSIASASRTCPRRRSSASRRSDASAPRRPTAWRVVHLVGRHRRRRLGHRPLARRHAHLLDHAAEPSRLLHPFRRQHLCRLSDRGAGQAAERRDLEQHRYRGEIQGRRDAGGVSRQLQIQSHRREYARVQRRGADLRAVGRSRGHQRLVPGRAGALGRLCGQEHPQALGAWLARLPRIHADAEAPGEAGRIYRKISYGPLLDVFMLDMRSYRGGNANELTSYGPDAYLLGPTQLAWLKRELMRSRATWKVIAADLPISIVSHDAVAQGDGPPRGRELEIADLLSFIKHAGIAEHDLDHGRHALHRGALLRSEPRGVPGLRPVLGVRLRPDPCRHLGAGQARQHIRPPRGLRDGLRQGQGENSRPASACSSSATWRSTATPRS